MMIQKFRVLTVPFEEKPAVLVGIVEATDTFTAHDLAEATWGDSEATMLVLPVEGSERKIKAFMHEPRIVEV